MAVDYEYGYQAACQHGDSVQNDSGPGDKSFMVVISAVFGRYEILKYAVIKRKYGGIVFGRIRVSR